MKQQRLPALAANYCASLQYSSLVKAQTHPLFIKAYAELARSLSLDDSELSKVEQEEDSIVCD
jgi:hypothetical protein